MEMNQNGPDGYNSPNPGNQNFNGFNNYNDYNKQPIPNGGYPPTYRRPGNSFSMAALVMGILAIISTMIFPIYLPFFLGSLAILFALLSKGRAKKFSTQALAGVTCGTVGIGLNVAVFAAAIFFLLSQPELMREAGAMYDDMVEQMYGVPSEDILGESMEDMMKELFPSNED